MSISSSEWLISVRRSSPKRSAISDSSSLITASTRVSSPRIARSSAIRSVTSACSCLIASASSAVSCERRRSRIARRLDRAQLEALDQLLAGGVAVARGADQLDDRVEVLERGQQALEDVRARLLLGQLVLGAPDDHLALVGDVVVDHRAQVQRPRDVVDERDHVHAERGLHRRVLVELVEHDLRDRVALELDHEAHAALVGLVARGRRSR